MYEWRSHTAEVELYVEAPTEAEVYAEAADAFGRLVERSSDGEPAAHALDVDGTVPGARLVNLLEELIYLADTEGFVPDGAEIELGEPLRAQLHGRRTEIDPLVKAATYHGLEFARHGETWRARVILDV